MLFTKIAKYKDPNIDSKNIEAYIADKHIRILKSLDNTEKWGYLLHISISRVDRNPTWEEIKEVRNYFFNENEDVMMILPKKVDYINIHNYCFHLWKTPESWDIR